MRQVWITFFLLLLAGRATAQPQAVALVLTTSAQEMNLPTVHFYQAVQKSMSDSAEWKLAPVPETRKYLRKLKGTYAINALPAISRRGFIKSHGQAKYPDSKPGRPNRVQPNLQRALDTLALQGAVVVDCIPDGSRRVRSCGLFYYDRNAGKVVASVRKHFRLGIPDAGRWAHQMVAGLDSGIKHERNRKSQNELSTLLAKSTDNNEENDTVFMFGIQALGESLASVNDQQATLAQGAIQIGLQSSNMSLSLEGGQGHSILDNDENKHILSARKLGLVLGIQSKALESLIWQLGWGMGAMERKIVREEDGEETGALRHVDGYLSLRPGMFWALGQHFRIGTEATYTKFLGGQHHQEGVLTSKDFSNYAFGLAFSLITIF